MKNKHIYKFFDQTKKISELISKEEIEKLVIKLFLFVSIFSQTFFSFMSGHFMSFSFFTAWHI